MNYSRDTARPVFALDSRSCPHKQYVYPVAHFTAARIREASFST